MPTLVLLRVGETIVVDGRPVRVRRIVAVTPTHVVVEHLDGRIEAIELRRLSRPVAGVLRC